MTRLRPGRETEPAIVRGETDGAEERVRTEGDRASHLLPRRWRPRKVGAATVSLTERFADRTDPARVTRRARV
jgi:hypothetical protein